MVLATQDLPQRLYSEGEAAIVLWRTKGSPDPYYHPEAQANALTDIGAGAMPDDEMGGITPLKRGGESWTSHMKLQARTKRRPRLQT